MSAKLIQIKDKKKFNVKNASATRAEVTLYGTIGEDFWGDSISARDFNDALGSLPDSVNQIDLRINSGGGDVFDGFVMYNRLKQHKAKVTVYIDGMAASIASIIALAGDEIIMGETSYMMIHKPWTMAMGNSLELEEVIDRLNDIEEQLLSVYQKKTKKDRSELRAMLSKDFWMDADQTIEMGFADRKMEGDESIDMAACLKNATWIKSKPNFKGHSEIVKSKVDETLKEMKDFLAR